MTTHSFVTGDGCTIAYRLDGPPDLPVLVLSNSIATDLGMWDGQIAQLTDAFRVLRYDMRGHGASDAPVGAYSIDRLGRDVIELLDDLAIERVHFCGLSLGGFVGQWLGYRAPERLRTLVLSNTSPYLGPAAPWDDLVRKPLEDGGMAALADMFMANWFPEAMHRQQSGLVARFRATVLATPPQGLAGCFAVVRDFDLRRTNTLIDVPTLVIGGEDDTVTIASHSVAIADAIPAARLVILPGVHMLNVEQAARFVDLITGFCTGNAEA